MRTTLTRRPPYPTKRPWAHCLVPPVLLLLVSCGRPPQQETALDDLVGEALARIGKTPESIVLPKVPYPVSTPARMKMVDTALGHPPGMLDLGNSIRSIDRDRPLSDYARDVMGVLGVAAAATDASAATAAQFSEAWKRFEEAAGRQQPYQAPPDAWTGQPALSGAVLRLCSAIAQARAAWNEAGGQPTDDEIRSLRDHLEGLGTSRSDGPDAYRLILDPYHRIGARVDNAKLLAALLQIARAAESAMPALRQAVVGAGPRDWKTPMGVIRISGTGDDRHEGHFLLLIDLGGDDTYVNVGPRLEPGNIAVTIDLKGSDRVQWDGGIGPGAGTLGIGAWFDAEGNDSYRGGSNGLGTGVLGAGLFVDMAGNDSYQAGSLSLGVAQYGTGIFIDSLGNDSYRSDFSSQGYGGPAGVGMLVDFQGDDRYDCGGAYEDRVQQRVKRHKDVHYLSICQGYGFGFRPDVSGGIGLLMDLGGNDDYRADLFAQGGAYWFGLGLLIDDSGDDHYEAFEHCQGESLHLGAGFLGDWAGNDHYTGHEHCQGVGVDRAAGLLYDHVGDDVYTSSYESQGAGIKPYGVGILLDRMGNDRYTALRESQGYAKPDPRFPASQWPIGILMDLGGDDVFKLPYEQKPDTRGRVQNRQGVAYDR